MNFRIILTLLLIAYSTQVSAAPKRRSMSSRKGDENGKELEKKDEQRFKVKVPTPRNLSSTERRIAKIFSDDVIPIAQGLSQIAGGKEVQTAREAKIKLREQKAQTALRSRTATGRHRHASTPSSRGGGFGGTSWGGGGYRPSGQGGYGWGGGGGYRPTPNYGAQSSPSWGQSSPSTSYGSSSSKSPSTSSSDDKVKKDSVRYGGSDKSKKEKEKEELKKETQAQTDKILETTYKATLAKMQSISQDLASIKSEEDKQTAYQGRLKMGILSSLSDNFGKINEMVEKLNSKDREIFEKKYTTQEHKSVIVSFLPHMIRLLTASTNDLSTSEKNNCISQQRKAFDSILNHPFITTSASRNSIKSIAEQVENSIASYYHLQAQPQLTKLQKIAKKPPTLKSSDQKEALVKLMSLSVILQDIKAKFSYAYLSEPTRINGVLKIYTDAAQKSDSFYKEIKDLADQFYNSIIAEIKLDIDKADAAPDKNAFYKDYLENTITTRVKKIKDLSPYFDFLKDDDKAEFEKKYSIEPNKTIVKKFFPHLLGLRLYPTEDPNICSAQQEIVEWIESFLETSISDANREAAVKAKDLALATEYQTAAQPHINDINDAAIPDKTNAKNALVPIQDEIKIILMQKFPEKIIEPKELKKIKSKIDTAIDQALAIKYTAKAKSHIDNINNPAGLNKAADKNALIVLQNKIKAIIDQKFSDGINEPKKLNILRADIDAAIAKVP